MVRELSAIEQGLVRGGAVERVANPSYHIYMIFKNQSSANTAYWFRCLLVELQRIITSTPMLKMEVLK